MEIWYSVYKDNQAEPCFVTSRYANTCAVTDKIINANLPCKVVETTATATRILWSVGYAN